MTEDNNSLLTTETSRRIDELYQKVVQQIQLKHSHLNADEARQAANNFIAYCQLLLEINQELNQNLSQGDSK